MSMSLALARQRRGLPIPHRGGEGIVDPLPAPVGGWNARDSLDAMKPEEATELVNWFPGQGECVLRNGSVVHATGLGAAVETLAEFNAGSDRKMIAAADGKLWNVTGAAAATLLAAGFISNRWQWAQFDDAAGGARMGLVNGSDQPQIFNGNSIAPMAISGTNLAPANLNGINIHRSRSYFWDTRRQDFWYSAVNALGGGLTKFPLGRVAGTGGNLISMGTWTRDGGDGGTDDLAVFFLDSGDVVIYAGDNPGSATGWELVGIFKIGAPLGPRALQKVGADLVATTSDGYVPLSRVLASERSKPGEQLSDKIRKEVLRAVKNYRNNFGWQTIHYPDANMAIFNVPVSSTRFDQHVVNTLTGAWCKFEGWNARCFTTFNGRLYFGGNGTVYLADEGRSDAGANINASAQTAWTYLKSRRMQKEIVAMRYILEVDGPLEYMSGTGVDFKPFDLVPASIGFSGALTPWSAPWGSPWSASSEIAQDWLGAGGLGYAIAARLEIATSLRIVKWLATQYRYKPGRGSFS